MVEAAVNSLADAMETVNRKDYRGLSAQFNVQVLTPQEAQWAMSKLSTAVTVLEKAAAEQ